MENNRRHGRGAGLRRRCARAEPDASDALYRAGRRDGRNRRSPLQNRQLGEPWAARGRLNISGVGLYEARLNGVKIGEDALVPFLSHYPHETQYQTYDVTPLLREENVLEALTGKHYGGNHRNMSFEEEAVFPSLG